jgi:hypothetical protein
MVVPLRQGWHLGIERPQISVEQIVFVIAAELGEGAGNPRLLFGDDVPPYLSIRKLALRRDRTIGIDVVAAVDEEIRPVLEHGRVGAHPAAGFVDAPAAAGGVA